MSTYVELNTAEIRDNLYQDLNMVDSNVTFTFPKDGAKHAQQNQEQARQIEYLEKQLASYKMKCSKLEAKTDEQNHIIVDMKQMINRAIKTEDGYLTATIKNNVTFFSFFYLIFK